MGIEGIDVNTRWFLIFILVLTSCVSADGAMRSHTTGMKEFVYSLSDNVEDKGYMHVGSIGKLWIYFDTSEGSKLYDTTIFRMDPLAEKDSAVALVRGYLFEKGCEGKAFSIIEYQRPSENVTFLPQVFSVLGGACVEVKYYTHDPEEGFLLRDSYRVLVKE